MCVCVCVRVSVSAITAATNAFAAFLLESNLATAAAATVYLAIRNERDPFNGSVAALFRARHYIVN